MRSCLLLLLLSLLALCFSAGSAQETQAPVNPIPTPVAGQCYLEGYDVNTLSKRLYWTFSVADESGWFVPADVNVSEIESVDVSMAFCKPLPTDQCTIANSSFCQHVRLTNGSVVDVDLGDWNKTNKFVALSGGDTGFELRTSSIYPVNSTQCQGNVSTIMTFNCSESDKWNDQNITTHLRGAVHVGCEYVIAMRYNGSCYQSPTVSPASCQFEGFDTATLSNAPYWFAEVAHTACYNGSDDDRCTIIFSFCHEIPDEEDSRFNLAECNGEKAAVCQIGHEDDGGSFEYSMGTFHDYTIFRQNDEDTGFHMEVFNGSKPDNGTKCEDGLTTTVILNCEPDSVWPENRDLTDFIHAYYDDHCQYTIKLPYNGACLSVLPTAEQMSPFGWIFIGLFLGAVVIYLCVGMAFQYFVKGARGADVVPHYTFWSGVVSLIGDGFKYTLDIITCFKLKGGPSVAKRSTTASGVQYDQI